MDIASRGRTTVLVSHRPTTHGWVDRVVQVVGGAIVADSPRVTRGGHVACVLRFQGGRRQMDVPDVL